MGRTPAKPNNPDGMWSIRQRGSLAWFLHRVSAVLIAVLIVLHLWERHYGAFGKVVTFENTVERLQNPVMFVLAVIFAAVVVYHTLNGLRAIILDLGIGEKTRTIVNWAFLLGGIGAFAIYVILLLAFILFSFL